MDHVGIAPRALALSNGGALHVSHTYYATKDQAIVEDAAYGMWWDAESKGTLNSVIKMIRQNKPVVVYLAPKKTFQNVRSLSDVVDLLINCDRASVQRCERELGIAHVRHRAPLP